MLVWRVWRIFSCMLQVYINLDPCIHRRAASSYLHVAACRIARRRVATYHAQAALPGECISAPAVRSRRKRVEITGCAAAEVCMQQGQPGRVSGIAIAGIQLVEGVFAGGYLALHYSCALMPSSGRKGTARGINAKRAQHHYCSGTDGAHGGRECRSGACLHVARAVVIPRGTMTSTPMGHMTARAYPSESVRGHALDAEGASMQHDHKAG